MRIVGYAYRMTEIHKVSVFLEDSLYIACKKAAIDQQQPLTRYIADILRRQLARTDNKQVKDAA